MEVLNQKIAGLDLTTLFLGGASKSIGERILTPIIGNGTFKSGVIKIFGSTVLQGLLGQNKFAKAAALGIGIDGVEDIVTNVLSMTSLGAGNTQDSGVI